MCGLIAIADKHLSKTSRDLSRALERMERRGPDQEGEWLSPDRKVRFGHRRLSIVDLSEAGGQPMFNEDHSIALVCNGEIYNYPSLKNRLEGLGHTFRSHSDSEVILHAYEQWGTDCVDKLLGMFAFVIWDSAKQKLFAARDHVGIKPLYYAPFSGGVGLASNLDALIEQLDITPEPDPLAVAYSLAMRYVPSPLAMWKGTAKLEPGHKLVWSPETGIRIDAYWKPPTEVAGEVDRSDEQWRSLFHEVLEDHLLADVPIGVFLSGGLDSTAVAAGLKKIGYSASAISASLPEFSGNEYPVAEKTARQLGFDCHAVEVKSSDASAHESDLLRAFDEPELDSAALPAFLICQQARQKMKVVFGGDGGDECFGGYKWYHTKQPKGRLKQASRAIRRRLRHPFKFQSETVHPLMKDLLVRSNPLSTQDVASLLANTGVRFDDEVRMQPFLKHFHHDLPRRRALQQMDLMTFCTDQCLFKVDRASMCSSLEVRVPFLDRRVVEWSLTSPISNEETDLENSKPLLRRYVRDAKLGHVLKQPKSGFSMKGSETKTVSEEMVHRINESWMVRSGLISEDWQRRLSKRDGKVDPRHTWILNQLAQWLAIRVDAATNCDRQLNSHRTAA